jgi:hypothetical protein
MVGFPPQLKPKENHAKKVIVGGGKASTKPSTISSITE